MLGVAHPYLKKRRASNHHFVCWQNCMGVIRTAVTRVKLYDSIARGPAADDIPRI